MTLQVVGARRWAQTLVVECRDADGREVKFS